MRSFTFFIKERKRTLGSFENLVEVLKEVISLYVRNGTVAVHSILDLDLKIKANPLKT